jgi:hypothetical protein
MATTPQGVPFIGYNVTDSGKAGFLVYPSGNPLTPTLFDVHLSGSNAQIVVNNGGLDDTWFVYKQATPGSPTKLGTISAVGTVVGTTSSDVYYVAKSDADAVVVDAGTGTLAHPAFSITCYPTDTNTGFVSFSCFQAGDITSDALPIGIGGTVGLTTANEVLVYGTPGAAPIYAQWNLLLV